MDKSKWDTIDWREWLDANSEDAVVAKLKWQFDRITALRKLVRKMSNLLSFWNQHFPCAETYELLTRPEVQEIMKEVEDGGL